MKQPSCVERKMDYKVEIKCETVIKEEPVDDGNDDNDFDTLESTGQFQET